jgi:hypothetical protein
MSEKILIKKFHACMRPEWVSYQIETPSTASGFPDRYFAVEGRHGLIEFKYVTGWPTRPGTVVKVEHFTPQQKAFLNITGSKAGGGVFLVIQIGPLDVFIFDYKAAQYVGDLVRGHLEDAALYRFHFKSFNNKEGRATLRANILEVLKYG